jgi:hypothetical protein
MISIFKTNIENKSQVQQLKAELDLISEEIIWNFDLEDCDRILRVDTKHDVSLIVIEMLVSKGFSCVELI